MPLDNSLNISELLRRLGVKGDSLGSAPLLESLRLSLLIGDLSDLVAPVGVPFGAAALSSTSAIGTFNKWSLLARSAGGLMLLSAEALPSNTFDMWMTEINTLGGTVLTAAHNFSFRQNVDSQFLTHPPGVKVAPAGAFRIYGALHTVLPTGFPNRLGPGDQINIESVAANNVETISISWKEYPAGINPG
ncbi:MAG TPA: hypothetical protein ENH89_13490 [Aurantimonas coralicida]|uniref:Uncharacterized protein n=1 Tax=Aurantimonas coralicida TaxID=182270 RepID=A0A9C9NGX0_9HYPH|nr:hypothetical protein [Aurantimonas coralicida]